VTKLAAAILIIGVALAGCGTGATGSVAATPTHSPTPAASADESDMADAVGTIHAEISGGPLFGTYDAASETPLCTSGLAGDGSFGVQYALDRPDGLSRLEILIPVAALASTGTEEFTASIGFGPLVGGTTFEIDPVAGGGNGSVTLDYDGGSSATVHLEGETGDGIGVDIEVECRQVVQL
jgi:hypothetical protein